MKERRAHREDVRALVQFGAGSLFRRRVVVRAHDRRLRRDIHVRLLGELEQTEIAYLQVSLGGEQEIVGLEIAMDDRMPMGVVQAFEGLSEPERRQLRGWAAMLPMPAGQIAA